jgi:hypothetical protein
MIVLIAPTEKRKERGFCSVNSLANVAACPEPMPGRNEHRGAASEDDKEDFRNSDFVSFICLNEGRCCFINMVFDFKLTINPERPNKPESKGRRGSFTGRLKVKSPRSPAKTKTVIEIKKFSSLKII